MNARPRWSDGASSSGGGWALTDLAEHGKHGDAAVLDLDVAEAVEALLRGALDDAERVPEAERLLDAELRVVRHRNGRAAGRRVGDLRA